MRGALRFSLSRPVRVLTIVLCLPLAALAGCGKGSPHAASPSLASFPGHDPRIAWDGSGRLHAVYVEDRPGGPAVVYRRVGRVGKDTAGPVTVSPAGLQVSASREVPPTLDLLPDGTLITGYPVKLPGKWKSELRVQRSTDGGATWSEPRLLHPPEDGAHSLLSSATSSTGTAVFAWLANGDGSAAEGHMDHMAHMAQMGKDAAAHMSKEHMAQMAGGHKGMGIRTASTRDGLAFTPVQTVDSQTCQCCGTDLVAGRQGRVWLAYRDLEEGDVRDFRVLSAVSDPPVFSPGVKLSEDHWQIRGCPETGARLAEAPDGTLWAAWFTGAGEAGVYVTFSKDGGASFAPRTFLTTPDRLGKHPEIGILPDGRVAVLYETPGEGDVPTIQARLRDAGGTWSAPKTLVTGAVYPRLAIRGDRAALAFTCRSGAAPSVVVADWKGLEEASAPLPCAPEKVARN